MENFIFCAVVVPANFVYITTDKNCPISSETELEKRNALFQDLKLKFCKFCFSGNGCVEVGRVWSREEVSQKVIFNFFLTNKVFTSNQMLHYFIDKYGFNEVF